MLAVALAVGALALAGSVAARSLVAGYWVHRGDALLASQAGSGSEAGGVRALRRAVAARPDIAENWRLLAQASSASHPDAALASAREAVQLQPDGADNWETLGMIDFQLGDAEAAINALERAVRSDPGGEMAHWRLANLAWVLGQQPLFWQQLRATAAGMDVDMVDQVLSMARAAGASPAAAATLLPSDRPLVQAVAARNFVHHGELAAAASVFDGINGCAPGYETQVCADSELQLLQALTAEALAHAPPAPSELPLAPQAWNHGLQLHLFHGPACARGAVTDGAFLGDAWLGTLCTWRDFRVLTYALESAAGPGGSAAVRFDLPGTDNEQGTLTEQPIWLQAASAYQVTLQYRGDGPPGTPGLGIAIVAPGGRVLVTESLPLQPAWTLGSLTFSLPASTEVAVLQFNYIRPTGNRLLHGSIELAQVRLRPLPRPTGP